MKNKKWKQKMILFSVCLVIAIGFIKSFSTVRAVFSPDEAVHIVPAEIENSTLLIGTHLIHLSALSDELYAIALQSATESAQSNVYYKSELADGSWFEISTASSLADIMEEGSIVSNEEIQAVYLTHHTKSNGVTYDLRNNRMVGIFDLVDYTELSTMEELEPLKNYNTLLKKSGEVKKLLDKFFSKNYADEHLNIEELRLCQEQMNGLQNYYITVKQREGYQEQAETIQRIMGKLDAFRKNIRMSKVRELLDTLQEKVQEEELQQEENVETACLEAIAESQARVSESLFLCESTMLSLGTTVMENKEYRLGWELIEGKGSNIERSDQITEQLMLLLRIMNSQIITPASEITMLDELISEMEASFVQNLSVGETPEYRMAVNEGKSSIVLKNLRNERKQVLESIRSEQQFYVKGKCERLDQKQAQNFMESCLQESGKFLQAVKADAMKYEAGQVAEAYVQWLKKMLTDLAGENESSELELLLDEKNDLAEKMLEALEKNDLDKARRYEVLIEKKVDEINRQEGGLEKEIDSLNQQKVLLEAKRQIEGNQADIVAKIAELDSKLVLLQAKMPEDGSSRNVQDMKNHVLAMLQNGGTSESDLNQIKVAVDGLGAMMQDGSASAGASLKEIYQKMVAATYLSGTKAYDDFVDQIEETIIENENVMKQNTLTTDGVIATMEGILGVDITAADSEGERTPEQIKELGAAVVALAQVGEDGNNRSMKELSSSMTEMLYQESINKGKLEGIGMFPYFEGIHGISVPVSAVAAFRNYRYVWSDSKKMAYMTKGADYYQFTAFEKRIQKAGKEEVLPRETDFRDEVYLPLDYVEKEFNCFIICIEGTDYAIMIDKETKDRAEELTIALQEKGGYEWE